MNAVGDCRRCLASDRKLNGFALINQEKLLRLFGGGPVNLDPSSRGPPIISDRLVNSSQSVMSSANHSSSHTSLST